MKAIRIHEFGGPDVLVFEDVPVPEPGADEVLIKVKAAAVNPIDWKVRQGGRSWGYKPPFTLGWDVSGIIEKTGAKVKDFKEGDVVYGLLDLRNGGAYAEYVSAKASWLATKPDSLDHIHSAAVPLVTLTAWQAIFDIAGLSPGQTILVHAAAGGVGHMAVQLAKWKGARVAGTASARNMAFLRELGVDEAIDYTARRFEDVVRDVDVVLDTMAGDIQERSWKVLKKGGIMVSTLGDPSRQKALQYGARGAGILVKPNAGQLKEIAGLIDAGRIKAHVETVLPLSEVKKAHELSQGGHVRGKIVLEIS
jgi:NADPH:quinone reductase-like Zn-dependent oxidoreductase